MYKTKERFLFWVIHIPFGIVFLSYVISLTIRIQHYYFAEQDSPEASVKYIFLDDYSSFSQLITRTLIGLILLSVICSGFWLYEYYTERGDAVRKIPNLVYDPKKRFSQLVVFLPLIVIVGEYLFALMVPAILRFYSGSYPTGRPSHSVFLTDYESFGQFAEAKLFFYAIAILIGLSAWLIEFYSAKNSE